MPKLATKIMQWLDPQPDDIILDIGCGGKYKSTSGRPLIADGAHDQQMGSLTLISVESCPVAKALSMESIARRP